MPLTACSKPQKSIFSSLIKNITPFFYVICFRLQCLHSSSQYNTLQHNTVALHFLSLLYPALLRLHSSSQHITLPYRYITLHCFASPLPRVTLPYRHNTPPSATILYRYNTLPSFTQQDSAVTKRDITLPLPCFTCRHPTPRNDSFTQQNLTQQDSALTELFYTTLRLSKYHIETSSQSPIFSNVNDPLPEFLH